MSITYVAALLLLAAFGQIRGPTVPQFVTVYATGLFTTETCTAFLLFNLAQAGRSQSVMLLACAYLYSGLMALLHLLTFPGALLPGEVPLLGTQRQALYRPFQAKRRHSERGDLCGRLRDSDRGACGSGFSASPNYRGQSFCTLEHHRVMDCGGSSGGVLSWMVARGRKLLFLWLYVVLLAFAGDVFVTTWSGGRYTFGFYCGRLSGLLGGCVLFFVFIARFARQNRVLAHEIRRRERPRAGCDACHGSRPLGNSRGGVAHDFNNLLTAIMGNVEFILARLNPTLDATIAKLLAGVKRSVERGAKLSQDLLAFARQQTLR